MTAAPEHDQVVAVAAGAQVDAGEHGVPFDHYVPVVLTKHAECDALRDVSWHTKERMTPMFVVAPVAWSYDADGPATSISDHVARLPARLAAAWGGRRAFLDTQFVPEDERMDDGSHVLTWVAEQAGELGVSLVPVTGLRRSTSIEAVVAEVAGWDGRGLCLRLPQHEWPTRTGPVEFRRLLGRLQADPGLVDLVLDLGDLVGADEEAIASGVIYELAVLPFPDAWRSITVVGSSIPMLHPVGVRRVHRREWHVHRRLVRDQVLPRRPGFGDYGVAHPDPRAEIDLVAQHGMVTVRHTIGADVVIARGRLHEAIPGAGVDGRTVPAAALWIRSNPDFLPGHCPFEDAIQQAAARRHGDDEVTAWRGLAMRHHLDVVVEQLDSSSAPPASGTAAVPRERRRAPS